MIFSPIGHKDFDPAYRQAVRDNIARQYGPLRSISSREELIGEWIHSLFSDDGTPYIPGHDGTVSYKFEKDSNLWGKWEFAPDRFTEHTGCEPAREYGLDEGTWNIESYHCMRTSEGVVVLWNGDGSLQMTLTPRQ